MQARVFSHQGSRITCYNLDQRIKKLEFYYFFMKLSNNTNSKKRHNNHVFNLLKNIKAEILYAMVLELTECDNKLLSIKKQWFWS